MREPGVGDSGLRCVERNEVGQRLQVNQTGIVVNKASSQLLMSMGLFSPDERYDAKFLSNYADVNVKDALKRIKGVGEVRIFGEMSERRPSCANASQARW